MNKYDRKRLVRVRDWLREVTAECRDNMHEPDEQELGAVVSGYVFNNAHGSDPFANCAEMTVGIGSNGEFAYWFNLADLVALARLAVLPEDDKVGMMITRGLSASSWGRSAIGRTDDGHLTRRLS